MTQTTMAGYYTAAVRQAKIIEATGFPSDVAVWVSSEILDITHGADGRGAIYRIEVPVAVFEEYEEAAMGERAPKFALQGPFRESVIPADVLNQWPRQLGTACPTCGRWTAWRIDADAIAICPDCAGWGDAA